MKQRWSAILVSLVILGIWAGLLYGYAVYVLANTGP